MTGVPASWVVPGGLPDGGYIIPDPPYHDGEPITEPALWITDEPVPDVGPMFARLLAAHGGTGLWPLLLTEMSAPAGVLIPVLSGVSADLIRAQLYPPGRPWHKAEIFPVPASRIDELDAGQLLARDWDLEVSRGGERFSFGADAFPGLPRLSWPGLADPASPGADPVDKWWARWQAGGRDALLSRPRGRRACDHQVLSEAEQAREGTPLRLRLRPAPALRRHGRPRTA